jgi:hypothetical protein
LHSPDSGNLLLASLGIFSRIVAGACRSGRRLVRGRDVAVRVLDGWHFAAIRGALAKWSLLACTRRERDERRDRE